MPCTFFTSKFAQSFLSVAAPLAKKSKFYFFQATNATLQTLLVTKATTSLANRNKAAANQEKRP